MWEYGGIFILHEEVDYMLTPKQNMLEVIKGGNPDRFVNQYEAVQLLFHPFMFTNPLLQPGQENVVNAWGVTNTFPKGVPGSFPVHTPDKIVVKDIEDWKDYVHAPSLKFTQDQWDMVKAQYDAENRHLKQLSLHRDYLSRLIICVRSVMRWFIILLIRMKCMI